MILLQIKTMIRLKNSFYTSYKEMFQICLIKQISNLKDMRKIIEHTHRNNKFKGYWKKNNQRILTIYKTLASRWYSKNLGKTKSKILSRLIKYFLNSFKFCLIITNQTLDMQKGKICQLFALWHSPCALSLTCINSIKILSLKIHLKTSYLQSVR